MIKEIMAAFRVNVLIGLLLLAPLAGTLLIVNWIIGFISNQLVPASLLSSKLGFLYRLAALLIFLAALYGVGLLTRNFLGKKIYRLVDWILTRIPLINSVYTSIRQISESIASSRSTLFKDVVAVQFPRLGLYSVGFVTAAAPEIIAQKIKGDHSGDLISVFVPTAPNPTTGFYLLVPRAEVVYLNISVAAAMKLVITAGAATSWKSAGAAQLTLLDHIDAWLKRGETVARPPLEDQPADLK